MSPYYYDEPGGGGAGGGGTGLPGATVWTPSDTAYTNSQLVSDGLTTTYVWTSTPGIRDIFSMNPTSNPESITALHFNITHMDTNTGANTLKGIWRLGNIVKSTETIAPLTAFTTTTALTIARPGGGSWVPGDLLSLEIGYESVTCAVGESLLVSDVWITVTGSAIATQSFMESFMNARGRRVDGAQLYG